MFSTISSNSINRVQSYAPSKLNKHNWNFPPCKNSFFLFFSKLYNSTKTWKIKFESTVVHQSWSSKCPPLARVHAQRRSRHSLIARSTIPWLKQFHSSTSHCLRWSRRVCRFDKHVLEGRFISCSQPDWDQGYWGPKKWVK